ncbi:MAG: hypothetical protein KF787_06920 [Phycisphaeraceae bacterium]|nr:hypothetical protein [Phycisphaerae bacterium]MBX3392365.1 hypothetical protein [Phycisphaeraceae bacterium]
MPRKFVLRSGIAPVVLSATCGLATGQTFSATIPQPTLDRWVYPFAFNPGNEFFAPLFGAIEIPGFDDRDAQLLVGFNTAGDVPTNLPPEWYTVESISLTVWVGVDEQFVYDDTFDSFSTLLQTSDPRYTPDSDLGKPVEVFGVGYRNGFNALTFLENSPFGGPPLVPPAEGNRNVFAAVYDLTATTATDVSRQVRLGFDASPLGIATIDPMSGVMPGDLVPVGTEMTADLDPCLSGGQAYLRRSFSSGRINLMVSSLSPAQGGPDGGSGDPSYPSFYTKENATAAALGKFSRLSFVVTVRNPADFDRSGFVDTDDFDAFVRAFEAGDAEADIDGSCFVDTDDFDAFVRAFEAG